MAIDVVRSSDPAVRRRACDVSDFFVDVPYEGEIVRARVRDGALDLHEGGDSFVTLPATAFAQGADQPHAGHAAPLDAVGHPLHALRDRRGRAGLSSPGGSAGDHLRARDEIDRSDEAYTELSPADPLGRPAARPVV